MTTYRIALLEGDGVGPEISKAALRVLEAAQDRFGFSLRVEESPAGDACLRENGEALPGASVSTIERSDACLKAPVGSTAADVIVRLRQMLKLYANIRPAKSLPGVQCFDPRIDFVIVRENTEDLYRGMEFEAGGEDAIVALRLTTRSACERIAKYAFRMAAGRRRSVVAVHKSNVLRKGDGLFARVCREVSGANPGVEFSEMLVDSAAMNLIRAPLGFDVIVTTNMYGDILSDEAAQLVGGLGLAPSANIGDSFALFEPVHGSAPDIAGKSVANPVAMVLTSAMMLEWLAESRGDGSCGAAADAVRGAVNAVLAGGERTPDLGGKSTTSQVGEAIAKEVSHPSGAGKYGK